MLSPANGEEPEVTIADDVLRAGLRVVFCGTALGAASARAGAYYAGPGNKFWPTLHAIGLTPRTLAPSEFAEVLEYDIGLTDLCKSRSGSDLAIGNDAFDVPRLAIAMESHRPGWLAFNGKRAAKEALGLKRIDFGAQEVKFAGVPAYVLPSSSGAANGYWDIAHWRQLARLSR